MAQEIPKICIKCLCCDYRSNNESDFLKHVNVHRFEPKFKIPCPVCPQILKSIRAYNTHKKYCVGTKTLKDSVDTKKETESTPNQLWQCQNCPVQIQINAVQNIIDFQKITKHIFVHSRNHERYNVVVMFQ